MNVGQWKGIRTVKYVRSPWKTKIWLKGSRYKNELIMLWVLLNVTGPPRGTRAIIDDVNLGWGCFPGARTYNQYLHPFPYLLHIIRGDHKLQKML